MSQTQFRNVDPPAWVAWNQAKASIRVRFLRMMITTAGIGLGIAFFASMMTLRYATSSVGMPSTSQMDWLVCTSLVMCLVGVTNSMLMSVTERFREIGTIKCLGASDSFIVKVFFLEAMLLGAIGSLAGAAGGTLMMAIYLLIQKAAPGGLVLLAVIAVGTGVGCLMTILAAIAPAIQASKMPAAAALRVEI